MRKLLLSLSFLFFCAGLVLGASLELEKALTLLNDGKTDEAMNIIKTRIESSPKDPDNYMAIGLIYLEQEDYSKAKENFQKTLEISRKNIAAHYMLAMIYEKENNISAAIEKWQRIVKYSKNEELKELAQKHIKQLKQLQGDLK